MLKHKLRYERIAVFEEIRTFSTREKRITRKMVLNFDPMLRILERNTIRMYELWQR